MLSRPVHVVSGTTDVPGVLWRSLPERYSFEKQSLVARPFGRVL